MRVAIGLEYDGSNYLGWQTQAQKPTVQQTVESALSRVADRAVQVHGSGRTDTGVHARQQVAHFETDVPRPLRAWVLGTNTHLPDDLRVIWAREVPADFHARFSAVSRYYRYRICNRSVRPALDRATQTWIGPQLDVGAMHQAAQVLRGEHDFTSFRALACQARHAVRRLHCLAVTRRDQHVSVTIEGNAFLHHMVRNIVGSLLDVGLGKKNVNWIDWLLEQRDRTLAGVTAPARGLCLEWIRYPDQYALPKPEPLDD